MNACPACSQAVSPTDLVCPKCGISLHPGTATAGPASGGGGKGLSVVAIVIVAVVGIVVLVGCLGTMFGFLFFLRAAPVPMTPPPAVPVAVPATMPVEEIQDAAIIEAEPSKSATGDTPPGNDSNIPP